MSTYRKYIPVLLLSFGLLAGCQSKSQENKAVQQEKKLVNDTTRLVAQKRFLEASESLRTLVDQYPSSPKNKIYLQELMHAEYMSQDYEKASQTAKDYLNIYAHEEEADYALFIQSQSLMQLTHPHWLAKKTMRLEDWGDVESLIEARNAMVKLTQQFPHSQYFEKSYQSIGHIDERLANRDIFIADFYKQKGAIEASQARLTKALQLAHTHATKKSILTKMKSNHIKLGQHVEAKAVAAQLAALEK